MRVYWLEPFGRAHLINPGRRTAARKRAPASSSLSGFAAWWSGFPRFRTQGVRMRASPQHTIWCLAFEARHPDFIDGMPTVSSRRNREGVTP